MKRQIEDYLRERGVRYFRGHHDDEYFFLVDFVSDAYRGRLNVHLEGCDAEPDAVVVTITPERYYAADRADWLRLLADRWNSGRPAVEAVVHGSCDPRLVGMLARARTRAADLAGLTDQVEAAVAAAIDLFGRAAGASLPTPGSTVRGSAVLGSTVRGPTVLRDAG